MAAMNTCPHCGGPLSRPELPGALAATAEVVVPGTASDVLEGPDAASSSGLLRFSPDPLPALVAREVPAAENAPFAVRAPVPFGLSIHDAGASGIRPALADSADDHRPRLAPPRRWPLAVVSAYALAATLALAWLLFAGGAPGRAARKATTQPSQSSP